MSKRLNKQQKATIKSQKSMKPRHRRKNEERRPDAEVLLISDVQIKRRLEPSENSVARPLRQSAVLQMQQQQGNIYVQNLLAQQPIPQEQPVTQTAEIQRTPLQDELDADKKLAKIKAELDSELEQFAKDKGQEKALSPKNKGYAMLLQEMAYSLTHTGFTLLAQPQAKKDREGWSKKFTKAYLLSRMILESGQKAKRTEEWATLPAQDLAKSGFVAEALRVAEGITNAEFKELILTDVLEWPGKLTAAQLKQIAQFFIDRKQSVGSHVVLTKMTAGSCDWCKKIGKDKTQAVLETIIHKYKAGQGANEELIESLAKILLFYPAVRDPVSNWLWTQDKEFLFELLQSKWFGEPGYDRELFPEWTGKFKTPEEEEAAAMKNVMPWVYEAKQKYYIDYLVGLGAKVGVAIPRPKKMKFNDIRKWLDSQTENIGMAVAQNFPDDPQRIAHVYEQIADIFFHHVDRGNVTPDRFGKLGKLKASDPQKMRLKADCDVLATYAMRLLKSSNFTPIGYLLIDPAGDVGHATALLSFTDKDGATTFYAVNNKEITELSAKNKGEAIKKLRDDALLVYESKPASYEAYYGDAGAKGEMLKSLMNLDSSFRRKDLE